MTPNTTIAHSSLKAQVLTNLDADGEVVIDMKYLKLIWQDMGSLITWCEAWKLFYEFFQEANVTRSFCGIKIPIRWLRITRVEKPSELTFSDDTEREIINEADASF